MAPSTFTSSDGARAAACRGAPRRASRTQSFAGSRARSFATPLARVICVAIALYALLRGRDVVRAPLRTRGAPCACALVVRVAAHPPLGHVRGRTVAVTPSAGHGWFGAYLAGHFVQYNNTHGKAAWLKRLPPGRSAPPPTAGGVKLLFSCHAPHEVVFSLSRAYRK